MFVALLICLVGIAVAQPPRPCETPPQWEGRVFDIDESQNFSLRGRLSYDSVNHRERFIDEIDVGPAMDNYDTIDLFDLGIEFVFNFRSQNCTRRQLTRPWRDFGIRPDATNYGEAYIGSSALPSTGLLVTFWGGNFTTPTNQTVEYFSSWTYVGCVPVDRTTFSRQYGVSHTSFYDVTVGIGDPSVFIPRRQCLSDEEWANRYTLFGTPTKKNI